MSKMQNKVNFQVVFNKFDFSFPGYCKKIKEPSLANYLPIAGGRLDTYQKCISAMWNANSLIQDLNSGHNVSFLCR